MRKNILALMIGALGALGAYYVHLPLWVLAGPALAVAVAGVMGLTLDISGPLRQAAFVLMGLGVGTGMTPQAAAFLIKTPPAFVILPLMLLAIMFTCQRVMMWMGYSASTALLASSPGHLSLVLALASDRGLDTSEISVIQMIRILVLMFSLPIIIIAMGYPMDRTISFGSTIVPLGHIPVLIIAAIALGLVFERFRFPAAMVLSGMVISGTAQLSGATTGVLPNWLTLIAFGIIGCLIGTRFSGVSPRQVLRYLGTGFITTAITLGIAFGFAAGTAWLLNVPVIHMLVTMAPGGLETMVSMGAILGANSSFVAAMHVWRLLILTMMVPITYVWWVTPTLHSVPK